MTRKGLSLACPDNVSWCFPNPRPRVIQVTVPRSPTLDDMNFERTTTLSTRLMDARNAATFSLSALILLPCGEKLANLGALIIRIGFWDPW